MKSLTKVKIKRSLIAIVLLAAFSLVGEMDYQDAVAQHNFNCQYATYSVDNHSECE